MAKENKKKLFISAYSLGLGGIETALIAMLKKIKEEKKYEITLCLEKEEGIFLDELDKDIKIIKFTPDNSKNIILRKIKNMFKQIIFRLKYNNKFDSSISYATYSIPSSFTARVASKKNSLFVHGDYSIAYNDPAEYINFFKEIHFEEFNNIIFVSETGKQNFIEKLLEYNDEKLIKNIMNKNIMYINNYIEDDKVIEKSKNMQDVLENELDIINNARRLEIPIFLNVGRHNEHAKKLTRLIEACHLLKEHKITEYLVILVGDGHDTKEYKELVKEYGLENNIFFFGAKKNPYPYFRLSDYVVLTSEYEGYPVVFLESLVLDKTLITTDVSDARKDIKDKFGIVINKNEIELYEVFKDIILKNTDSSSNYVKLQKLNSKFDIKAYNCDILEKLKTII